MEVIKCIHCGKTLCEAGGEVRKICPKCKGVTHVVVTSKGIYNVGIDLGTGKDQTVYRKVKK